MKFYVTFDCGFDENDGDECRNDGILRHPFTKHEWIVDANNQEDMKLLAIILHYAYERVGGESSDYDEIGDDDVLPKLLADEFLKKMDIGEAEIKKAVDAFSLGDYFPSAHSMCAVPHDYWFNMSIEPAENTTPSLTDDFLLKSWQSAQGSKNA